MKVKTEFRGRIPECKLSVERGKESNKILNKSYLHNISKKARIQFNNYITFEFY